MGIGPNAEVHKPKKSKSSWGFEEGKKMCGPRLNATHTLSWGGVGFYRRERQRLEERLWLLEVLARLMLRLRGV